MAAYTVAADKPIAAAQCQQRGKLQHRHGRVHRHGRPHRQMRQRRIAGRTLRNKMNGIAPESTQADRPQPLRLDPQPGQNASPRSKPRPPPT